MTNIKIPTPLRNLTKGAGEVEINGDSITALIENLNKQYPGIRDRLMDEKNNLRRFVNIYVNGDDIRFLKGLDTKVKDVDEVSIVPAIAGG